MCSSSGFSDLQANLASIHKPPSHSGMAITKMTTTSLYAVVFIALLSLTLTSATLQIVPGATWTGVCSSPHILPDSQHSPASRMTLSISLTLNTRPPLAPSLPSGLTPLLPTPLSTHHQRRLPNCKHPSTFQPPQPSQVPTKLTKLLSPVRLTRPTTFMPTAVVS